MRAASVRALASLAVAASVVAVRASPARRRTRCQACRRPSSTTKHRIVLNGKPLAYTARAGVLPIRHNETGEPRGYIFFVSYTVDRRTGQPPRPLTFAWNGGPGANALLVHLSAFGPRRLTSARRDAATARVAFEDNQATWLDETDLVFVDPIGTGFSRPAKPEYARRFLRRARRHRGDRRVHAGVSHALRRVGRSRCISPARATASGVRRVRPRRSRRAGSASPA